MPTGSPGPRRASIIAFASLLLWPVLADAAQNSCGLSRQQKSAAAKAFRQLYPLYQDERCLNCHGAMNPLSPVNDHPGGWVNIRKAARELLAMTDPPGDLLPTDAGNHAARIQALQALADGSDEDPITDNDVIRGRYPEAMHHACRECHVKDWIIPMSPNHFTGRSWRQLCLHMKAGMVPPTPDRFLAHMQEDELVLLGFQGRKGLKAPVGAEPPAMPFATMVRHANDWIAAMDAQFRQPPECGCGADGIALEIRHRLHTDPQSGSSRAGFAQFDGTVVFTAVLQREPGEGDAIYRDELTVIRPLAVKHVGSAFVRCTGSGTRQESWQLSARPDANNRTMLLHFSFVGEAEQASWTCTGPGYRTTEEVYPNVFGMIDQLSMPARSGSVGEITQRNESEIESFTVTVTDSPLEEQ